MPPIPDITPVGLTTYDANDLSLIAEEATETLLPLAEQRGLTIETSGDMTPTIGSHALLLQLSTNLVHNAIVHNLPEQGIVWVTTAVQPKSVELTVENTGEKLTPEVVAALAEPFLRGTERIRIDHAGVGLGLAIVKSITQAHDGTSPSPPGPPAGSASRCNYPPRHRTLTGDHQGMAARPRARARPLAPHRPRSSSATAPITQAPPANAPAQRGSGREGSEVPHSS
jgi:K+-sensing histidine kinase KdpD